MTRKTIQQWHGGQLIMAWLGGIFMLSLLMAAGMFALKIRAEREESIGYRREALEKLARDSLARVDRPLANARIDTLNTLRQTNEDSALQLATSWGLLKPSELKDARAILDLYPHTSTLPLTALLLLIGGLALVIPLFLWWATWVWFGGRAARPPAASNA